MAAAKIASVALAPAAPPGEVLLADGARLDGRGFEEFRPMFLSTGVVSQAAGSAYAELGGTKVMAAVYGPRASERRYGFSESGRLTCEVSYTSWARSAQDVTRQKQIASEREVSALVQGALEASVQLHRLPKSAVDVFCLVMEAGGADAAVAITAASLALADAGIELRDLVPACAVSAHGGQLLLDPTSQEASRQQGGLLLAMMPAANEITQLVMAGSLGRGSDAAVELAMGGCGEVRAAMRGALLARGTAAASAAGA